MNQPLKMTNKLKTLPQGGMICLSLLILDFVFRSEILNHISPIIHDTTKIN